MAQGATARLRLEAGQGQKQEPAPKVVEQEPAPKVVEQEPISQVPQLVGQGLSTKSHVTKMPKKPLRMLQFAGQGARRRIVTEAT